MFGTYGGCYLFLELIHLAAVSQWTQVIKKITQMAFAKSVEEYAHLSFVLKLKTAKISKFPSNLTTFGCFSLISIAMAGNTERTFIMAKHDAVQRGLFGKFFARFEHNGFKLVAMKFMWASIELLEQHYGDLKDRPFFPGLDNYMGSGSVLPMVWEGLDVVKTGRQMLGATNPADSLPGTIRGDFCIQVDRNILHGFDAVESAEKEIALWYTEKELVSWKPATSDWVYE